MTRLSRFASLPNLSIHSPSRQSTQEPSTPPGSAGSKRPDPKLERNVTPGSRSTLAGHEVLLYTSQNTLGFTRDYTPSDYRPTVPPFPTSPKLGKSSPNTSKALPVIPIVRTVSASPLLDGRTRVESVNMPPKKALGALNKDHLSTPSPENAFSAGNSSLRDSIRVIGSHNTDNGSISGGPAEFEEPRPSSEYLSSMESKVLNNPEANEANTISYGTVYKNATLVNHSPQFGLRKSMHIANSSAHATRNTAANFSHHRRSDPGSPTSPTISLHGSENSHASRLGPSGERIIHLSPSAVGVGNGPTLTIARDANRVIMGPSRKPTFSEIRNVNKTRKERQKAQSSSRERGEGTPTKAGQSFTNLFGASKSDTTDRGRTSSSPHVSKHYRVPAPHSNTFPRTIGAPPAFGDQSSLVALAPWATRGFVVRNTISGPNATNHFATSVPTGLGLTNAALNSHPTRLDSLQVRNEDHIRGDSRLTQPVQQPSQVRASDARLLQIPSGELQPGSRASVESSLEYMQKKGTAATEAQNKETNAFASEPAATHAGDDFTQITGQNNGIVSEAQAAKDVNRSRSKTRHVMSNLKGLFQRRPSPAEDIPVVPSLPFNPTTVHYNSPNDTPKPVNRSRIPSPSQRSMTTPNLTTLNTRTAQFLSPADISTPRIAPVPPGTTRHGLSIPPPSPHAPVDILVTAAETAMQLLERAKMLGPGEHQEVVVRIAQLMTDSISNASDVEQAMRAAQAAARRTEILFECVKAGVGEMRRLALEKVGDELGELA